MSLHKQLMLKIVGFACIMAFFIGCDSQAKFEAKARSVIADPQKLQDWAVPIIKEHQSYYQIPYTNWPDFLKVKNGPSSAWIAGWTTIKGNAVVIEWGYKAIIVGDKNFVMTDKDLGRPVIQWVPGIYFTTRE
jgi:hypothetical protein